jgi:hypothetical protein
VDVDQHPGLPPVRSVVARLLGAAEGDFVGLPAPQLEVTVLAFLVFLNAILIVGIVEVVEGGFA